MVKIVASPHIDGIKLVHLQTFADERGRFSEYFRTEWFPERSWETIQMNRSDSKKNVLRGLHFHFNQADYWCPVAGSFQVGLADLRRSSSTYGASTVLEIGAENQVGIFIPPGVAHGFAALTDATLVYVVDQYYNAADEFGVLWNDPALALDWQVSEPILSARDQQNPVLSAIPLADMPR